MQLLDFFFIIICQKKKKTDLMCFRKLFRALNVRESFLPVEYAEVPFSFFLQNRYQQKKYKQKKS